jgi:hypothetical protein
MKNQKKTPQKKSRQIFFYQFSMSSNVLVLGGVGFIGRSFVEHLIKNNLAVSVRVVDKALPATAYLSTAHKAIFADPRVEFKQANLAIPGVILLTKHLPRKHLHGMTAKNLILSSI